MRSGSKRYEILQLVTHSNLPAVAMSICIMTTASLHMACVLHI